MVRPDSVDSRHSIAEFAKIAAHPKELSHSGVGVQRVKGRE